MSFDLFRCVPGLCFSVVILRSKATKDVSSLLRVPDPSVSRVGLPAFVAAAFSFRCHPEPIRAQRGWARDLLLLSFSAIRQSS